MGQACRGARRLAPVGRGHLRRHMHTLAAVKVTAPMLGLLGTLLGLLVGLPAWWAHAFFASWSERIQAHAGGPTTR